MELKALGQHSHYYEEYNPELLEPIMRGISRAQFSVDTSCGFDLWRLYEITYLNKNSVPQYAMGKIYIDATSQFIVESKSLKLYIGSFTQTKFTDLKEVEAVITQDLSSVLQSKVQVSLFPLTNKEFNLTSIKGVCVDKDYENLKLNFNEISPTQLAYDESKSAVEQELKNEVKVYYSNALRTLCPVTSQPDFATVVIAYRGREINQKSLFSYICSYRRHQGFHEACTENIYNDIKNVLNPKALCVASLFTRRGGIDINPYRKDKDGEDLISHMLRAIRQ